VSTTVERFVIANAFGETAVRRVRGEFIDGVFVFDGGSVRAENVFTTELDALAELIARAKALLAALGG
jgi:hypothetical protein